MISATQLAVYSKMDVLVLNHSEMCLHKGPKVLPKMLVHDIDFKLFFKRHISKISAAHGILSIQYGSRSLLLLVGDSASASPKTALEVKQTKIDCLNTLSASFKRCLKVFGMDGYISLQE